MNQIQQYERLANALTACIERLSTGDDDAGLRAFLSSADAIEDICIDPHIAAGLEEPLRQVLEAISNQDIAGFTDVLSSVVYPLVKGYVEERKRHEGRESAIVREES